MTGGRGKPMVPSPFLGEDRHVYLVDPVVLETEGLPSDPFDDETDLLIDPLCPRVEREHIQRDAMEAKGFETVGEDQPGRLGA